MAKTKELIKMNNSFPVELSERVRVLNNLHLETLGKIEEIKNIKKRKTVKFLYGAFIKTATHLVGFLIRESEKKGKNEKNKNN